MIKKTKEPKVVKELGVGKMVIKQVALQSKLQILMNSQVVTVRGTKRMRA